MAQQYVIYCDESAGKGAHFSDFYGGALVDSRHLTEVIETLRAKKKELNFNGEVKWNKIPGHEQYAQKYIDLIDCFFDLIADRKVKIRIMFRQNTIRHRNLTRLHVEDKYYLLYYQLLKHGFGLGFSPVVEDGVSVRIYLDQIPDTKERVERFRSYIVALALRPEFRRRNISIRREDVTDVVSHDHDILQCLDIVLGAMHFKLNDLHKVLAPNSRRRAKRTRAKERVFKHISARIRAIYPNFNVGTSTGQTTENSRWVDPYRHWLFMPRQSDRIVDPGNKRGKRKKAGTP